VDGGPYIHRVTTPPYQPYGNPEPVDPTPASAPPTVPLPAGPQPPGAGGYQAPGGYQAQGGYPQAADPAYAPPPGYAYPPPMVDQYGRPLSDKSKVVAGVLQLVLGGFGAGRFYIGDNKTAVWQLVVTLITCGLGHIWGLIDGIMILVNGGVDAQGRVLRD
jgi:TM2 domain-containing membrane protein YozV